MEFRGMWWLPDNPEYQVPGTLTFDPDDAATLDLLGSFKEDVQELTNFLEPTLLLGFSSNGKFITLRNCIETQTKVGVPGMITSSFHADMVLVGDHFEREEDVGFERLTVEYRHLDEWAGISGFVLKIPDDRSVHPTIIEHTPPESVRATVGEAEVSLGAHSGLEASNPLVRKASLTQTAYLAIEYSERKPLDDLMVALYHLQNFLSLGVGKPVYPLGVRGRVSVEHETLVEIHYRPLGMLDSEERVHPVHMLFTHDDLPEGLGNALANWIGKIEDLEPVYQLYFGTMYAPRAYLRHQFLSLIQALEAYHRRVITTLELPDEEHCRRREGILDAVPDQYKDWLEGKLRYSNEPGLRKRLKEIFDKYPESVAFVVGDNAKRRKGFIHKVWATRNYLTHHDKELENQAARDGDLYQLIRKLKALLEICLLNEIGFADDHVQALLQRRPSST